MVGYIPSFAQDLRAFRQVSKDATGRYLTMQAKEYPTQRHKALAYTMVSACHKRGTGQFFPFCKSAGGYIKAIWSRLNKQSGQTARFIFRMHRHIDGFARTMRNRSRCFTYASERRPTDTIKGQRSKVRWLWLTRGG